ncbi:MAG: HEAT repeat domain-containing protein [Limisphaerales bacterium]
MKKHKLYHWKTFIVFTLFLNVIATLDVGMCAEGTNNITVKTELKNIMSSTHTYNIYVFEQVADEFKSERNQLGTELIKTFSNLHLINLNRCAAAYYLGEMRFTGAVEDLASGIALRFDRSRIQLDYLIKIDISEYPAMDALIKIGNPSIPAVIRNLAESDDAQVRKLSLQVLYRIDGDKDIVQLRLQKALKVETDSQKQARLQSALKALARIP